MLNVQTEHLENHTARLTVEIEAERLDQAMRQAARRIAKKARIPGFRPGKAPYQVVVNLYGRDQVLGEALDTLGNDVYREALDAAEIEPYAPGSLSDVEDDGQKLVFVVAKRPTVDLGDYRAVRVEYHEPEITDEMVNDAVENLRQNQAVVEPVERPAQMGDQVTFEHILVSVLPADDEEDEDDTSDEVPDVEDAAAPEDVASEDVASEDVESEDVASEGGEDEAPSDDEDGEDDEDDEDDDGARLLIHEHEFQRVLRDDKNDLFPGFSAELVGLSVGDAKEFTLVVPDDDDDEEIAGRTLHCEVSVQQVSSRTVPEWSDNLAKSISQDEFETMLDLRVNVRKQLQEQAENMAKQQLADDALDQIVEGAAIHYPEELIYDYASDLMQELDQNLRQQGLTLDDFMRITGQSEDDVRARYRDRAIQRAERALVLGEVVHQEQLDVSEDDIEAEINRMMESLGGQGGQFRQFLSSDRSRANISNQLATSRALDRLVAIARGENPPIGVTPEPEPEPSAEETTGEAAADVVASAEVSEEVSEEVSDEAPSQVAPEMSAGPEAAPDAAAAVAADVAAVPADVAASDAEAETATEAADEPVEQPGQPD